MSMCPLTSAFTGPAGSQARQGTRRRAVLLEALPLVEQEPGTEPWFAVRFGPSTFGIIGAFPDDAAREAHLGGRVGKALAERADELFVSPPEISNLDVLAEKP